jgi:ribosomal protein S18 acetylase RimI-like enzyme
MSEPGSGSPVRRPPTARRRTDSTADVPAPSIDELAAIERQLVDLPRFFGATVEEDAASGAVLVSRGGRGPAVNFAGCIRWPDAELDARLAEVAERFAVVGEWPALLLAEGVTEPAGLGAELLRRGWTAIERERVMWSRRPPVVPHLDPSTRLEAVTRRTVGEYERLEREVFGLAGSHADERAAGLIEAVERGELRAFLVRLHGEAVAVTRLVLAERVAGLYGVGVAAGRRRQGFGALVTAIATRSALATGNRLAWLSVSESNDAAVALYTALGYQPSFEWTRWLAPAGRVR